MNVKRGQIYYADLSPVVGSEQGGTRPVIVLQNDKGNQYSPTTIIAAITTIHSKAKIPTHLWLNSNCDLPRQSMVLLEQIRTIDKTRLKDFIGTVDKETLNNIDKKLKISLGL